MLKLIMLGAGTPTPARDRFGTACVLQIADEVLMFDCGPAATHKLVKAGLRPTQVDYLFITHHHFDHMSDYPCFLLCRWDQSTGGEQTLQVYGPEPIEWITDRLVGPDGAFSHDWRTRAYHPAATAAFENRGGTPPRPEPHYDIHQIGPGSVVERGGWSVATAQARHAEPWLTSLAYRVDCELGSVVFAADAGPSESLTSLTRGADVLVISCWDHQDSMDARNPALSDMIMGTVGAATLAQECGVKTLVVTHSLPNLTRPGSRERGIGDITRAYGGTVIFAEELMELDLA
jgi:ribonuclease BN (tRNA processing enzyme)